MCIRDSFYDEAKAGEPLQRNMVRITEECFLMGYFAFVSNAKAELEESLDIYKLGNEAEVVFKLMLGNLLRTTRVHSSKHWKDYFLPLSWLLVFGRICESE